jgi:hypothetical protein
MCTNRISTPLGEVVCARFGVSRAQAETEIIAARSEADLGRTFTPSPPSDYRPAPSRDGSMATTMADSAKHRLA